MSQVSKGAAHPASAVSVVRNFSRSKSTCLKGGNVNKIYSIGLKCKCGEYVAFDIVPKVAADIVEIAPSASHNSDYAAALKVVGEFCIEHSSAEQCIDFRGWLLQRINETRSHCA